MDSLKTTLKEIDSYFTPDLNFLNSFPGLSEFDEALIDCWSCYYIVGYGDSGDYEKESIDPRLYKKTKNAYKRFNYDCISHKVELSIFKSVTGDRVKNNAEYFLKNLEERLEEQNTDAKSKILIRNSLREIDKSIIALIDLKPNKYQKIVIDFYLRSYINIYSEIIEIYHEIFPDFIEKFKNRIVELVNYFECQYGFINELNEYIYPDHQESFLKIEGLLKENKFLNLKNYWIKSKNDLVRFYLYIDKRGYFKFIAKKNHLLVLRKLANRYNVVLSKQTNPNRIAKLDNNMRKFDFLSDI